jgi:hypothetical protein
MNPRNRVWFSFSLPCVLLVLTCASLHRVPPPQFPAGRHRGRCSQEEAQREAQQPLARQRLPGGPSPGTHKTENDKDCDKMGRSHLE